MPVVQDELDAERADRVGHQHRPPHQRLLDRHRRPRALPHLFCLILLNHNNLLNTRTVHCQASEPQLARARLPQHQALPEQLPRHAQRTEQHPPPRRDRLELVQRAQHARGPQRRLFRPRRDLDLLHAGQVPCVSFAFICLRCAGRVAGS
jgi:hypothetical protein